MKKRINWRAVVVPASTAVLVALLLSGAANAITDTVFRYSTPQTGYLALPANVFTPLDDSTAYSVTNRSQLRLDTDDFACFVTPVNLPQGADMTNLTVWYQNQSATLAVSLLRNTNLDIPDGFKELARRNLPGGTHRLGRKPIDRQPATRSSTTKTTIIGLNTARETPSPTAFCKVCASLTPTRTRVIDAGLALTGILRQRQEHSLSYSPALS